MPARVPGHRTPHLKIENLFNTIGFWRPHLSPGAITKFELVHSQQISGRLSSSERDQHPILARASFLLGSDDPAVPT